MRQGHTPLELIHFWGQLWSALFVGCRKREMLHLVVENVEIYLWKIGLVDYKSSYLNAPGSVCILEYLRVGNCECRRRGPLRLGRKEGSKGT